MNDKFAIGCITAIVVVCVVTLYFVTANAEMGEISKTPYPYVDPIREYYDNLQTYTLTAPEPVYYESFFIEPIGTVQCDSWTPVYGIIPESGLLVFTVISGDFIGYSNVSHMEQYYLQNYFYLPCDGVDDFGQIYITYIWNDKTDSEFAPNTKVKNLTIDRGYLQIIHDFEIN